jgi:hypothetical protein
MARIREGAPVSVTGLAPGVTVAASEQEWLTCADPGRMLSFVGQAAQRGHSGGLRHFLGYPRASERKLRLLACAIMRLAWDNFDAMARDAVEVAEQFADGMIAALPRGPELVLRPDVRRLLAELQWWGPYSAVKGAVTAQADLLRDLIGNPWQPLVRERDYLDDVYVHALATSCPGANILRQAWLTPTVLAGAASIYENYAFDEMPMLADALEEAGCANEYALHHLRGSGPHARGCHVLDAILGKH